jgi:hypothetical protein
MPKIKGGSRIKSATSCRQIRRRSGTVATHVRLDSGNISDLQTRELFETPAQVLAILHKVCDDVEKKNEPAWR